MTNDIKTQALRLWRLCQAARFVELEAKYFLANHPNAPTQIRGACMDLDAKAMRFQTEFAKRPEFKKFAFKDLTADQQEAMGVIIDKITLIHTDHQQEAIEAVEEALKKYLKA